MVHVAEQPSHESRLPSSQASSPHTTPSPQPVTGVQSFVHASQSSSLPSSQASPGSTMPSPQSGTRPQSAPHVPRAGGSQSSPHAELTMPSPQQDPVSSPTYTAQ